MLPHWRLLHLHQRQPLRSNDLTCRRLLVRIVKLRPATDSMMSSLKPLPFDCERGEIKSRTNLTISEDTGALDAGDDDAGDGDAGDDMVMPRIQRLHVLEAPPPGKGCSWRPLRPTRACLTTLHSGH